MIVDDTMNDIDDRLTAIEQTQTAIISMLNTLVTARTIKDWYGVDEVAERVGRTPYQVREWLRKGRIEGVKRAGGRGRHREWAVSHAELVRYQNYGLLPLTRVAS